MARSTNLQKGFSLIEIMIVIMIIGVLVAGTFGGLRWLQKAKETTTRNKLAALDTMIETYNTQLGQYPTALTELVEGPQQQGLQKRWGEPIAAASDITDAWNQDFVYSLNPKGARPPYELYSTGSKGDVKIYSPRSQEQEKA